MGPRTKRDIIRILPFGLIWMVFTIIYVLLEKSLLGNLMTYPTTGNPYRNRSEEQRQIKELFVPVPRPEHATLSSTGLLMSN